MPKTTEEKLIEIRKHPAFDEVLYKLKSGVRNSRSPQRGELYGMIASLVEGASQDRNGVECTCGARLPDHLRGVVPEEMFSHICVCHRKWVIKDGEWVFKEMSENPFSFSHLIAKPTQPTRN